MLINIILFGIALILYYLSFKSPKTDIVLYAFSGFFMLLAAVSGLLGYSDLKVSETITYDYTTVNNTLVTQTELTTPNYSENPLFTSFLPLLELLLSVYIFAMSAINSKNDR